MLLKCQKLKKRTTQGKDLVMDVSVVKVLETEKLRWIFFHYRQPDAVRESMCHTRYTEILKLLMKMTSTEAWNVIAQQLTCYLNSVPLTNLNIFWKAAKQETILPHFRSLDAIKYECQSQVVIWLWSAGREATNSEHQHLMTCEWHFAKWVIKEKHGTTFGA